MYDEQIRVHIEQHQLLEKGDRVLIAVSGGPDSFMLLHWLLKQRKKWQLEIVAAHVHHQLRGIEADEDQRVVEDFCREQQILLRTQKVNVPKYAAQNKLSKQTAARECRYQMFDQWAAEERVSKLALGHHGDDQVETMVMRLIRGAGLYGLSGMPVKRQAISYSIIRPLLPLSKEQILAYCEKEGLPFRQDSSNLHQVGTRNRIRHRLLPDMKRFNPNLHQSLYELSDVLREEDRYLNEQAQKHVQHVIKNRSKYQVIADLAFFREVDLALQRRMIFLILDDLAVDSTQWGKVHIDALLHMIHKTKGSGALDFPQNVRIARVYDELHIHSQHSPGGKQDQSPLEHYVYRAGSFTWGKFHISVYFTSAEQCPLYMGDHHATKVISADDQKETRSFGLGKDLDRQGWHAFFDAAALTFPLTIRTRRAGDRIQGLGMGGHQKVKDLFINQKVPREKRVMWPIVESSRQIIWVPGLKRSETAKITDRTTSILHIEFSQGRDGVRGKRHPGDTD